MNNVEDKGLVKEGNVLEQVDVEMMMRGLINVKLQSREDQDVKLPMNVEERENVIMVDVEVIAVVKMI